MSIQEFKIELFARNIYIQKLNNATLTKCLDLNSNFCTKVVIKSAVQLFSLQYLCFTFLAKKKARAPLDGALYARK
jgi:hypothetical protein